MNRKHPMVPPMRGRFDRDRLPPPLDFMRSIGLEPVERRGTWRTFTCPRHLGKSLRMHTLRGSWACMAGCGSGGDLVSFEQWRTGADFPTAARALGACWVDDPTAPPMPPPRPAGLSAADALQLLAADAESIGIEAARAARLGRVEDSVRDHLLAAAGRILAIVRSRRAAEGGGHA